MSFSDEEKDKYSTSMMDMDLDKGIFKVECNICHDKYKIGWCSVESIIGVDYFICRSCGGVNIIE